jgi:hypothetical protein
MPINSEIGFINIIKNFAIKQLLSAALTAWCLLLFIHIMHAILNQNYSIYFNYAQISLTLFGFTLLGTIIGQIDNIKQRISKEDIKKLIGINLNFLLSSISFLIIYSCEGVFDDISTSSDFSRIVIVLIFLIFSLTGLIGLSFGTVSLYKFLRKWYYSIIEG